MLHAGQGLGKSSDCILSVAGKYVGLWWLSPWRGKGLLNWKMALSVVSRPTGFRHSQMLFVRKKKNSCFWPFKMGSIVQSIFISLWCVCFASAEAKCHICHVCSGFYSLLLIILYRPMREPASISMNWQAHVLFSLPECTGLLVSWQFFLCIVWWWLFFPNIFGGPLIFNDIMEITNFDHDP